jgi:hypothetical protein
MARKKKSAREVFFEYLTENGPSTMAQVVEDTGVPKANLSAAIKDMRYGSPRVERCIYIKKWVQIQEGARRYPRPLWALGTEKDAPKPKPKPQENATRWRRKKRTLLRTNFVFNLANNVKL